MRTELDFLWNWNTLFVRKRKFCLFAVNLVCKTVVRCYLQVLCHQERRVTASIFSTSWSTASRPWTPGDFSTPSWTTPTSWWSAGCPCCTIAKRAVSLPNSWKPWNSTPATKSHWRAVTCPSRSGASTTTAVPRPCNATFTAFFPTRRMWKDLPPRPCSKSTLAGRWRTSSTLWGLRLLHLFLLKLYGVSTWKK